MTDFAGGEAVFGEPEVALLWLIRAEREGAGTTDLALLAQLWASNSQVVDRRGSTEANLWYRWQDRDAVLNRYVVAVFPHDPPPLEGDALANVRSAVATAVADSPFGEQALSEGAILEVQHGADRWQFVYEAGRWWILELSYSS